MLNQTKQKLMALIISFNEANNLKELIEHLNFVDEIIIVDSFSTDQSKEIALKYEKVTFIEHAFLNYSDQRNFALNLCKNNWVLFLDADERISDKLKAEIINEVNINDINKVYYFNRRFYFNKKPIYFCGLQKDKNVRLFYNSENVFYKGHVHEKLNHKGKSVTLKNNLMHYSYENYKSYKSKMERYGILKAEEKIDNGKKTYKLFKYLHPIYTFINKFIIRLGFIDGFKGITLCYLMAYSVRVRYNYLLNK